MPAHDLSGPVKRAVVELLKGDAMVSAIAGNRAYDYIPAKATYPYSRCVTTIVTPFEATGGISGSLILVQVDTFTKEYGTAEVSRLNAAVADCLNEAPLALDEGYALDLTWLRSMVISSTQDQGVNHGVVEFEALASM